MIGDLRGGCHADGIVRAERGAQHDERRPRILWADDNADVREYVQCLLAPRYEVEAYSDGESTLKAALAQPPDLVLSDVMMPRMDGVELLRHLRSDPRTRDVPVILVSARAGDESRVEGLQPGADDYLVKPFSARELIARVSAQLEMARVRRESEQRVTRILEHITEAFQAFDARLDADLAGMVRLQEVSTRLVRAGEWTSLLQDIVDAAIALTAADMGNIQLLDRGSAALRIVASRGFELPFLDFFNAVHDGEAACGTAMQQGVRVVVDNVATSPIFAGTPALDVALAAGVKAVQSTPLVARSGRVVGMLSTHYRTPRGPAERDLRILDQLARQAADWIERTQADEALRESEERYRSLISQVKDVAIFSSNDCGIITTWNAGCEAVLGYAEQEFVGLDTADLFTPEDRVQGVPAAELQYTWEMGTTPHDRWMSAKGGRRFFALGSTAAMTDSEGRHIGFSTVIRDVTQMKLSRHALAHRGESLERLVAERTDALERTAARLRLSERMASIGTLSAGLGHDMGNLLFPLGVRLDMLLRADLPPELLEHVVGIQKSAQHLQQLSTGLQLLAIDPSSSQSVEPTEVGAWWSDVGMMLKNVLPSGIRFEHALPAEECWIAVGRAALTQVLFNLVQNAADALRERGSGLVRVTVAQDPGSDSVVVRVSDDGPGMTADVVRRYKEPYLSGKANGVSTSMGLPFVHGLVTGIGGRVEIDSTLARGTRVSLTLPRATPPAEDMNVPLATAIVDLADARMRSFISSKLRELGFEVRRGLEQHRDPKLIVTGAGTLGKLAKGRRARNAHVIVIGGRAGRKRAPAVAELVELGPKPDPDTVCEALRSAAKKIGGVPAR